MKCVHIVLWFHTKFVQYSAQSLFLLNGRHLYQKAFVYTHTNNSTKIKQTKCSLQRHQRAVACPSLFNMCKLTFFLSTKIVLLYVCVFFFTFRLYWSYGGVWPERSWLRSLLSGCTEMTLLPNMCTVTSERTVSVFIGTASAP